MAVTHGWSRNNIGSHVVRNNRISHCEQNGIHGSLGGIFSIIHGNTIHDIAVRGWIGRPDVAGLKLLAPHDVIIRNNHIHRCVGVGGIHTQTSDIEGEVNGLLSSDRELRKFAPEKLWKLHAPLFKPEKP